MGRPKPGISIGRISEKRHPEAEDHEMQQGANQKKRINQTRQKSSSASHCRIKERIDPWMSNLSLERRKAMSLGSLKFFF